MMRIINDMTELLWCLLFLSHISMYLMYEWTAIGDKAEIEHYGYQPIFFNYPPTTTTLSPFINRYYDVADRNMAPDFRIPEKMPVPVIYSYFYPSYYKQYNRPYRFSSSVYISYYYANHFFKTTEAESFACYCSTAYIVSIPLAACAVLTTRHILTTASSTERVLKIHGHRKDLKNILGVWYEMGYVAGHNATQYGTPARIHYHPWYTGLDKVNSSHPVPLYDLSVWALTIPTYAYHSSSERSPYYMYVPSKFPYRAIFCKRASSHEYLQSSPELRESEDHWVFGYQFIRAYNRKPNPYIKYGVRTKDVIYPCAKKEWGWFLCIGGRWAPLGIDSGAPLHRSTRVYERSSWNPLGWVPNNPLADNTPPPIERVDGLVGMLAFSLNLRSNQLVHYFTVIETHHVLDFLYDAYMGRLPYAYLDYHFDDTQWAAPKPKKWFESIFEYPYPEQMSISTMTGSYYPGHYTLL